MGDCPLRAREQLDGSDKDSGKRCSRGTDERHAVIVDSTWRDRTVHGTPPILWRIVKRSLCASLIDTDEHWHDVQNVRKYLGSYALVRCLFFDCCTRHVDDGYATMQKGMH